MASKESSQRNQAPVRGGIVERTLKEVRIARLVASHGGHYLLDGVTPFSNTSNPCVHFSSKKIFIFPNHDDESNVQGLNYRDPNMETEEDAEVFAANVLTDPAAEVGRNSKVPAKRERCRGTSSRRERQKR
ncbi:hypothetical protein LIER_03439 [Lithospermum erythrorhizon]|uniref:Uncharacterized protein n=1 Tax=Lithospermum erythrorhizon TaxID=34254 RepID=A0AAV3NUG3_LITER